MLPQLGSPHGAVDVVDNTMNLWPYALEDDMIEDRRGERGKSGKVLPLC